MAVMSEFDKNKYSKKSKKAPPPPATPKKNETEIKRLEEQIRLLQQNTSKPQPTKRATPQKLTEKKNKYKKQGMA